jgi:hypothetical protein
VICKEVVRFGSVEGKKIVQVSSPNKHNRMSLSCEGISPRMVDAYKEREFSFDGKFEVDV